MAIGEVFISAFLQVLFDRLSPQDLSFFPRPDLVFPELQKWKKKLMKIEAVLVDAVEKQLADKLVKMWLDDLQDLAYDLDDLLDEFATEELERRLTKQHQNSNFLLDAGKALMSYTGMKSKMDNISTRLDQLWEDKEDFGLVKKIAGATTSSTAAAAYQRPPTTSVTTEPAIYGRDEDTTKILEMVLSDEPSYGNFSVIPIVAMGGAGKTTLARKVYNEVGDSVFAIKAWVCVSDDFDVLRISKSIIESTTLNTCSLNDLNAVQVKLKETISGKKFLLVLDDVWSKDYGLWEVLKSPFMAAASGSRIIVTTRLVEVALTMRPDGYHDLKLLSDDDCWSVFERHAFEGREIATFSNINIIRQKVVEKCRGLPLAARSLGGLLRCKQRGDEWLDILNSKIWDLSNEHEIPVALKLSYHHLPSHLKRCFAYCAIFPKDYEFEEEELVYLWMAEGLLQQSTKNKLLEDVGSEYFYDLLSRSIFQQSSCDNYKFLMQSSSNSSKFVMHDLIHDMAQWVSQEIGLRLEDISGDNKQQRSLEKVRHFSFISDRYNGKNKFEVFNEAEFLMARIRTFLSIAADDSKRYITNMFLSDLLPKFKKLRALSLRTYYITELPNSVGGLNHLRYMNLSHTAIIDLPESISSLYNLQTLMLSGCSHLLKLPSNLRNLINLRHLDIRYTSIREMPIGMRELKSLQKLSNFIMGKSIGSDLEDLKHLKHLRGRLSISRLNNVIDFDPRDLVLRHNKDLKELWLEWDSQFDDSRKEVVEENVLDMLLPHQNLEMLTITCYGGRRFPSWVGDPSFSNIRYLRLDMCENCTSLPSLGLLGSLKDLTISRMKSLKSIGSEIYGKSCSKPFQSLETLRFEYLQDWEHWEPIKENQHVDAFPCLRKLYIIRCPKLSGRLPDHLPSLERLVIEHCYELVVSFSSIPMLCVLQINGCKGLACNSRIDSSLLKSVTLSSMCEFDSWLRPEFLKVKRLKIKVLDCEQLMCLLQNNSFQEKMPQGLQNFTYVRRLCFSSCSNLVSFPEDCSLSSLSELEITSCNDLTSLSHGMMHNQVCLESLKIRCCGSLTSIVRGHLPSSLKRLDIVDCDKLECLWDDKEKSCTCSSDNSNASLLDDLQVSNCPSLTCLSTSGQLSKTVRSLCLSYVPKLESIAERFHNNASLESFFMWDCENLKSIPEGLHNLSCLRELYISDCSSIVCFPQGGLPKTILKVAIKNCMKLKSLPDGFHTLNSLQGLSVVQCPSITSFPEEGFPKNLTGLQISGGLNMYKPLVEWGLHNLTFLTSLHISGCPDAESFPQQEMGMLLSISLTHLTLENFPKLKCLSSDGFHSFDSLENLSIKDCPNLRSFPEQGLPLLLMELYITNCPLLKEECERDKGKYWSKISNIPSVHIDGRFIYNPEGETRNEFQSYDVQDPYFFDMIDDLWNEAD